MSQTGMVSNSGSRKLILGTTMLLGATGALLIFAPAEIAGALGTQNAGVMVLLLQLYGAALFGLAMTGWMVKDAIVGGIFGRSYVVGNAGHAFVGALTLARPALTADASPILLVTTGVYWLLAVMFGYLMFFAAPRS